MGKTILIVEDNGDSRESLAMLLRLRISDVQVITAASPLEIVIPDGTQVEIVITDKDMPDYDQGLQLIDEIRKGNVRGIPYNAAIVLYSGQEKSHSDDRPLTEIAQEGSFVFVIKPGSNWQQNIENAIRLSGSVNAPEAPGRAAKDASGRGPQEQGGPSFPYHES